MEKKTLLQILKIKTLLVSLLTYQKDRLTLNERTIVQKLYELIDDILCERVYHQRYTAEEYVDSSFIEASMILKRTRNTEIKKLVKLLEEGLKW